MKANELTVSDLAGRTITHVAGIHEGSEEVTFRTSDGLVWNFCHVQDCCENVTVADIEGDPSDLIGLPLSMAEESTREATTEEVSESGTWTFYRFATPRGYLTLRWLGQSNGYYGESVDLFVRAGRKVSRLSWSGCDDDGEPFPVAGEGER